MRPRIRVIPGAPILSDGFLTSNGRAAVLHTGKLLLVNISTTRQQMTLLFSGLDIQVAFKDVQGNAEAEIANYSDDHVLGHTIEDLTETVFDRFAVKPLVLDLDAKVVDFVDGYVPEHMTPNRSFDKQPVVKGRIYSLHVPYTGDEYLWRYMPMPPPARPQHASVSTTEVVFTAGGAWHNSDSINKQFDSNIAFLQDGVARMDKHVTPFNAALRNVIIARLAHRIESAKKARETTAGLKYPLRLRDNAPETFKMPEKPKPLALKPTPSADREFTLDEKDYQDILRICESMSLVMERSPTVFENAEEEHIRVHYLVQLNGQYQGKSTGKPVRP